MNWTNNEATKLFDQWASSQRNSPLSNLTHTSTPVLPSRAASTVPTCRPIEPHASSRTRGPEPRPGARLAASAQQGQEARRHMPDVDGLTPAEREQDTTAELLSLVTEAGLPLRFDPSKIQPSVLSGCLAGTCSHPGAGKPGHAAEVVARSQAFKEAAFDEGFDAADPDDNQPARLQDAYDKGAEAMRAACWRAVEPVLRSNLGAMPGHPVYDEAKAAIEGAAP